MLPFAMKIVVLDDNTLNPGDISWSALEKLGDLTVYDRTSPDLVLERAENAHIVLTNKTVLDSGLLQELPSLRYIGVLATDYNIIDTGYCLEKKIVVCNVPAYGTKSVAQFVFALILELAHHVGRHSESAMNGKWECSADFCYWDYPLIELEGLTMGIVGMGRIGQATARLAQAFGMKVLAHTNHPVEISDLRVSYSAVEELFSKSDIVSLHCPLTDKNKGMVHEGLLRKMKSSAFLINTGRGTLINESDLAVALNDQTIAGAGLDVLKVEPPEGHNPLLKAKNCIITPHIAWATKNARKHLMSIAIENIARFLDNNPQNVVVNYIGVRYFFRLILLMQSVLTFEAMSLYFYNSDQTIHK